MSNPIDVISVPQAGKTITVTTMDPSTTAFKGTAYQNIEEVYVKVYDLTKNVTITTTPDTDAKAVNFYINSLQWDCTGIPINVIPDMSENGKPNLLVVWYVYPATMTDPPLIEAVSFRAKEIEGRP